MVILYTAVDITTLSHSASSQRCADAYGCPLPIHGCPGPPPCVFNTPSYSYLSLYFFFKMETTSNIVSGECRDRPNHHPTISLQYCLWHIDKCKEIKQGTSIDLKQAFCPCTTGLRVNRKDLPDEASLLRQTTKRQAPTMCGTQHDFRLCRCEWKQSAD